MTAGTVVVVGEALIDAHLADATLRLHPGGGPFNTAVALARLGVPCRFLGAISRDYLGDLLEGELHLAGVDTTWLPRVDAPTPLAIVAADAVDAEYSFYLAGTAHEALEHQLPQALDGSATALCIGTLALATDPPGSAVEAFATRAADRLALVVDPNARPPLIENRSAYLRRFEALAAVAELVKLSTVDLDWLYPGAGASAVAGRLLEAGASCVVVTSGADGASGWTGSVSATAAAPPVEVVDTVGAGDAFTAGFLAVLHRKGLLGRGRLRGLSVDELSGALSYGAAAGAAQCTRASAWGPSSSDVERLLRNDPQEEAWQHSSSTM